MRKAETRDTVTKVFGGEETGIKDKRAKLLETSKSRHGLLPPH